MTTTTAEAPTAAGCGCDQAAPAGVSRRTVVRTGVAAAALGAAHAVAGPRYAYAQATPHPAAVSGEVTLAGVREQVLVVVSLRGGFDGLNAVVPAADPAYGRARPTVGVPASRLLPLDSRFGLHPALAPLKPFWDAGSFGVVHAVGQPNPTRSHFAAMAELERAAPGSSLRTGWLDRLLSVIPGTTTFRATQVGGGAMLGSLVGPQGELVMDSIDEFSLDAAWNDAERARWMTALNALHRGAPAAVAGPAAAATAALARTAGLKAAGDAPANGAAYPEGDFGTSMRDTARLIKAGVGLRVACVELGEWDFHHGMGTVDGGEFTSRAGELASALAAFATDLGPDRMRDVTVVTLSEFGRRVAENGSGGTDHGLGNAVLLLGGGIVGGRVHGRWPGLAKADLVDGDLAATTDYRLILAEIAAKRFGVSSASRVFPGLTGTHLGITRAA